MVRRKLWILLLLLCVVIVLPAVAFGQLGENHKRLPAADAQPGIDYVADEILVRFAPQATESSKHTFDALNKRFGAQSFERFHRPLPESARAKNRGKQDKELRYHKIKFPKGKDLREAIEVYATLPDILYVEPNAIFQSHALAPNPETNPSFSQQWYLTDPAGINAEAGWNLIDTQAEANLSSVVVAVIDSGVDYTHEDLADAMWINSGEVANNGIDDDGNGFIDDVHGADVVIGAGSHPDNGNPMDYHGHGTHVAGIIGAVDNDLGIIGVAPGVRIMAVKAGRSDGTLTTDDIAQGLYYAAENGADVINMSFGGSTDSQTVRDALAVAFNRAVLVASAGNSGLPNESACSLLFEPNFPAAYDYVLGVMASTQAGERASFSNWDCKPGNQIEYEVMLPGADILSTLPGNQYASWNGTSMAAPIASGLAALLKANHLSEEIWSNRLISGQVAQYSEDMAQMLVQLPRPILSLYDHLIYDAVDVDAGNDADGIADAGETVQLGLFIRNSWGAAKNVTVTVTPNSGGEGAQDDPYVTIADPDVASTSKAITIGNIGSYATASNGITYDESGQIVNGITIPVTLNVASGAPNTHQVTFSVHIVGENALDANDPTVYSGSGPFSFNLQNGVEKAGVLLLDETWTKDSLYIVTAPFEVAEGVTLTIEPGTEIRFRPAAFLSVRGTLRAIGTPFEKILFTADSEDVSTENSWEGIVLNGTSYDQDTESGTVIQYAILEKTYSTYSYLRQKMVQLVHVNDNSHSSFKIDHVLFRAAYRGSILYIGLGHTGQINNCIFDYRETYSDAMSGSFLYDSTILSRNVFITNKVIGSQSFLKTYLTDIDNNYSMWNDNIFYLFKDINEGAFQLRIFNTPASVPVTLSLENIFSFLGANSPDNVARAIIDYSDTFYEHEPLITGYSTAASPESPAVLINAQWEQESVSREILQAGEATLRLTFSRPIDVSKEPLVAFGPAEPYTDRSVDGAWVNQVDGGATEWVGTYDVTSMTGNGEHTLYIGGAVELESQFQAPLDVWRTFTIDTFSSQAMALQATGGEGQVALSWFQDDYDLLAGYNVYRSESVDGTFTRLNSSIIPKEFSSFIDYSGNPGQTYWYAFSVAVSNLGDGSESGLSPTATATSYDNIAPVISHTAVVESTVGQNITIRATLTDNVDVTTARLYYRTVGSPSFTQIAMIEGLSNLWTAIIPAVSVTLNGVEYYLEVEDRAVNLSTLASSTEPLVITINEVDTDGDGVANADDDFPNDPAASLDTDGDGAPDSWNAGATAQQIEASFLVLDAYPNDPTQWQNRAPAPSAPAIALLVGEEATSQVVHGDPDVSDTHTYAISTAPSGGSASVSVDGLVTFTSDDEFTGETDLTVQVTDNSGLSGYVTMDLTISPQPPVRHWDNPASQSVFASFWGNATLYDVALQPEDEVAAFDADGTLCGHYVVDDAGYYGLMHIYGDDPETPEDEGAVSGDVITFKIWSVSNQQEYVAEATVITGTTTWSDLVTSNIDLNGVEQVRIALQEGWNLISFPVARVWHVGSAPTIAVPSGVTYVPVTSLNDVLSSISGHYLVIRAYDSEGAKTFDPRIPTIFNDLNYLAGGYGYWIKMDQAGELVLNGPPLDPEATLSVGSNWSLLSYWSPSARHTSIDPPVVPFPEGTGFIKVNSILDIFGGLQGSLLQVRGFDSDGGHVFDSSLPEIFNDLDYMGPGYGYWIKLDPSGILQYDSE